MRIKKRNKLVGFAWMFALQKDTKAWPAHFYELVRNDQKWLNFIYRLTSSALWAIKNPCVFACILAPRGLMEILQSAPSSVALISIASKSSFNFVKHNLTWSQWTFYGRNTKKKQLDVRAVGSGSLFGRTSCKRSCFFLFDFMRLNRLLCIVIGCSCFQWQSF